MTYAKYQSFFKMAKPTFLANHPFPVPQPKKAICLTNNPFLAPKLWRKKEEEKMAIYLAGHPFLVAPLQKGQYRH